MNATEQRKHTTALDQLAADTQVVVERLEGEMRARFAETSAGMGHALLRLDRDAGDLAVAQQELKMLREAWIEEHRHWLTLWGRMHWIFTGR